MNCENCDHQKTIHVTGKNNGSTYDPKKLAERIRAVLKGQMPVQNPACQGNAEKAALSREIDAALGEAAATKILQELAMVIASHGLVREPDKCELLFRYMILVTRGWNEE